MLLISITTFAYHLTAEALQATLKQLRWPAELLVRGIAQSEDGKVQFIEKVLREIRAEKSGP